MVPRNNWPVSVIVSFAMRNSEIAPTPTDTHTQTLTHGAEGKRELSFGLLLPEFVCVRWEHKTTIIKGRLELPCSLGWVGDFSTLGLRVVTNWSAFDSAAKHDITKMNERGYILVFPLVCFGWNTGKKHSTNLNIHSVAMAVHYG